MRDCGQVAITFVILGLLSGCSGDSGNGGVTGVLTGFFRDEPAPSVVRRAQQPGTSATAKVATVVKNETVFFGVVAGDEPNSVLAAEKVLKSGGTAADAATTLALTLAVTMPSAASLGGGGVCLVHSPGDGKTEALDFIAPAPVRVDRRADRPAATPALLRGFAALHARYGTIDFRSHLGKAEQLARFGHVVSRASANEFLLAAGPLFADAAARRVFARPDGHPHSEGDRLVQQDLAEFFAELRIQGVSDFYDGATAEKFVRAARAAGAGLTLSDMRSFTPRWLKPIQIAYRDQILSFAPPPAGAGVAASQMWRMLALDDRYRSLDATEQLHFLAEVAKRAFGLRDQRSSGADATAAMRSYNPARATPLDQLTAKPQGIPENPSQTSFVVVDLVGQTVVCTLTNYNLFGTGRVAPGTGVVLAAAPGRGDRNALSLGGLISVNAGGRELRFAAAASGGGAATTALIRVAAETVSSEKTLERAMLEPRIHHSGAPDITLVEKDVPDAIVERIRRNGHRVVRAPGLGRVNAAECPLGLGVGSEAVACFVFADPRGNGLASEAER
jgi:gamma-glutamyltranspeptidase / glutathione hydrolase